MKHLQELIDNYENFDHTVHGLEQLLTADRMLAIEMNKLAIKIAALEEQYQEAYVKRKVEHNIIKLKSDGTAADRESIAIKETKELREKEGEIEGTLKAYKIRFDAAEKVGNSMSRWIKTMQLK